MGYRSVVRQVHALDGSGRQARLDLSGERPVWMANGEGTRSGLKIGLLAGEGLYLKTVTMPPMPLEEARATLLLTEKATIPFPLDHTRLAVSQGPITPEGAIYLVAVADAPPLDALRKAKRLGPITTVPMALAALRQKGKLFTPGGIDCFVHADNRVTGVHILGDDGVLFTRETGWKTPPQRHEQVAEIVRAVRSWRAKGERTLRGWIVGAGGLDRALRDELKEALGMTVTPYDPLADGIDGQGDGVSAAPIIGAALVEEDSGLTPTFRERVGRFTPKKRWPVAVALASLMVTIIGYEMGSRLFTLESERQTLQQEVERLTIAKTRFDAASLRLRQARDQAKARAQERSVDRLRWRQLYDTVSSLVPSSVALTGFTVDQTDATTPRLTLEGVARGDERRRTKALFTMVSALEEEVLSGKAEVTMALDVPNALHAPVRFTIVGVIRTSEGAFLATLMKEIPCSPV